MTAINPNFADDVRSSFAAQAIMSAWNASLKKVELGEVEIELPFNETLTQQNGFLHAGIITTIVDSACGYAALTVMPPGANVLSIEFKVNLLSPAIGERFTAAGRVVRAGRTIKVCQGDVYAHAVDTNGGDHTKHVALMTATMTTVLPNS